MYFKGLFVIYFRGHWRSFGTCSQNRHDPPLASNNFSMTLQNNLEKRHDPPPTIYQYLLHWFALGKATQITSVFYSNDIRD